MRCLIEGNCFLIILLYLQTRVSGAAGDWDSVHVKNLVTDWIDKPKNNFGIMIKASVDYEQDNNQSISDLIDRRVDHNETGVGPFAYFYQSIITDFS